MFMLLSRVDGFEQGLNNFHIQVKALGPDSSARKSPPHKKTKKTNLDLVLDSPKTKENKFGESTDKFMFLGETLFKIYFLVLDFH